MSSDQQQLLPDGRPDYVYRSIPNPAPKRLIICCDGTWQSSVSGLKNVPSNVTRIARSLARCGTDEQGQTWQQLVHYDGGIGTGDLSKDEKDRQGGFGIGFVGNVIEAYNFIVLNYSPGDQIFCFGFSRGAYTARAVAGLVTDIGIISPRDMQDFPDLYAIYQKNEDSHHFRKSLEYRDWVHGVLSKQQPANGELKYDKPQHFDAPDSTRMVQVVGVFDTVGSLGIPDLTWTRWNLKFLEQIVGIPKFGFHNVSLSPYIKHAFHALALDEHRGPFSPTLWHLPVDGQWIPKAPSKTRDELYAEWKEIDDKVATQKEKQAAWAALIDWDMYDQLHDATSELSQVWFPGVHINVGGGSDSLFEEDVQGDFEQIALISYAWMVEQVSPYLQFVEDLCSLGYSTVTDRNKLIHPVLERISHGEKDFGTGWVMKKAWQLLDATGLKKAELRKVAGEVVNGWATGPIVDSFTGKMVIAGSIRRSPGQYQKGAHGELLGLTFEMIHPSIAFRKKQVDKYDPPPLKDFERRKKKLEKEGYEWRNEKLGITIPEYLIKPHDLLTRIVARQDANNHFGNRAMDFIGNIDRIVGAKTDEADSLVGRETKTGEWSNS